ncbi:MAG TPA: sulfite exporter TauE/SafE family protein [Burkholderiales bacterium]|nr:sulfite exporter TauE/SafE family protein [Burkholderiales bacterium]
MDGSLVVVLSALFLGCFVSGVAGFAMGVIVTSVWLHILEPIQCATLVVGYGFVTQGYGVWKLRHAFSWRRVAPFMVGGLLGVPIGTYLLARSNPNHMRLGIAVFVVVYSLWGLLRPAIQVAKSNTPTDVGVGFVNGLAAGLTGLIGIVIAIWCQLRGWTKDVQRTVFQPVMLATSLVATASFGAVGAISSETLKLFLLGLPFAFAGTWLGLRLYGRIDELMFRRIVLVTLLLSGASLIAPAFLRA